MKKTVCVLLTAMVAAAATAAEVSVNVDGMMGYVWRGQTFNDGLVLQPSVDVAHPSGLGLNVWANMDAGDYDGSLETGEFSEVDLTVSYTRTTGPVEISAGYIEYLYPATSTNSAFPGTREVYASAGVAPFENLSLTVAVYYDVDEVEGVYASADLGYTLSVSEALELELGATVGYAGEEVSAGGESGLNEYVLRASAGYAVSDGFGLGIKVGYVDSLDKDVLPEQDVDVFGGVSASYSF